MLSSKKDIEILKLICWCKNVPAPTGKIRTGIFTESDFRALEFIGMLAKSRDSKNVRPTPAAYSLLQQIGYNFKQDSKPQSRTSSLERRHIAAEILFTFYRAGVSVFNHEFAYNGDSPMYTSAFAARLYCTGNPYGSNRFYGVFYTKDTAYLVLYADDIGVHHIQELALFHKLIDSTTTKNTAIIMMGESTEAIAANVLKQTENRKKDSQKNAKSAMSSFSKVFSTTSLPVHFIPIGDAGAQMLRFMQIPNYRDVTAKAILKRCYKPPYEGISDTDTIHCYDDNPPYPAVVVVDMDVHRIDRALESAKEQGFEKIVLYALAEQRSFLKSHYLSRVTAFTIDLENIAPHLNQSIALYSPPETPYVTNGRYITISP